MGLFSRRNEQDAVFEPPGNIVVDSEVLRALPDPGAFLLDLVSDFPGFREAAAAEISRVRHQNGGLPYNLRQGLASNTSAGPLYLLHWITSTEFIPVQVWASHGLKSKAMKNMMLVVENLVRDQGVPAAATWVHEQRGPQLLGLDFLASQLLNDYEGHAATLTNGTVIDSFKKWKR